MCSRVDHLVVTFCSTFTLLFSSCCVFRGHRALYNSIMVAILRQCVCLCSQTKHLCRWRLVRCCACSCRGGLDWSGFIAALLAVCRGVNSGGQWETVVAAFISNIPAMEKTKESQILLVCVRPPCWQLDLKLAHLAHTCCCLLDATHSATGCF